MIDTKEGVAESVGALGVKLCPHSASTKMKLAGFFHTVVGNPRFLETTFVTQCPYIYHPESIPNPLETHWKILAHELVHWRQQKNTGTTCWTTRYLTSWKFRWQQERWAFLRDIYNNRLRVSDCVNQLKMAPYWVKHEPERIRAWFMGKLDQ